MPHVVTIKGLPQAFDVIKEMDDQGYDWGEDYRRAGRDAVVDFLEGRMHEAVDRHLETLAEGDELARPVMARATRLHADQAGLQLAEERHHLAPAQCPADDDLARLINCMYLKNVLGQIKADSGNLHNGWLIFLVALDGNHTLAI